ncbi:MULTISPECIES: alpha/beta hydrolase [Bacillus subtilis group]|uniref:alpha/beta hydrolase n=1 Tax=Bacillus subtilis group TaxID=653685 RepID=UPI0002E9C7CC|nr:MULTISPECIES: alpha/beta fold hydrolase [Bacillus subtilis group]PPA36056.1 alpha/beta hydrolase [Bacillus subtilis]AMA52849.1 alpha/beta hydrolase [Bacillus inaquosorum]MBT2193483.1 alpha/beta hydrolase [Bacillus inaquosorum]MBT3120243.1 lysophospholipase [Bacillus inaquosorum]MBT3124564.1 lysophospholipase [Bacillus inaquosorum]
MGELEVIHANPTGMPKTPPLLFVHGANHAAWCWKENFLPFFQSHGFQSYALSFRGHGHSEGRGNLHTFTMEDYVEDVYNVLETLEQKPIIIGHSMGGAVVQKVMHQHPDRIEAAVLIASIPPGGMFKDFFRLLLMHPKKFRQLSLYNQGKTTVFPVDLFLSGETPEELQASLVGKLQPESTKASRDCLKRVVPKNTVAQVPLLVLGTDGDTMISKKTTQSIGRFYQTEPVIFPKMCHDMMLDPDWRKVAEQILAFSLREEERMVDEA